MLVPDLTGKFLSATRGLVPLFVDNQRLVIHTMVLL